MQISQRSDCKEGSQGVGCGRLPMGSRLGRVMRRANVGAVG
jgi:hypothetical protein